MGTSAVCTHRRENITDSALAQFRTRYHDPSITKWDIFHYIYAVLHHPEYRQRYAANLRRELPRIPLASLTTCHPEQREGSMQPAGGSGAADESIDPSARKERGPQDDNAIFKALVTAGQRLAEIHYEQQPEYKLTKVEKAGEKLDYRVTKMKLSKDKTTLLQPIPNPQWHPKRNLRLPPRQPLRPRMGHRPVPGLNRSAQRHNQRSQPRRRSAIHPLPHLPGNQR